MHNWTVRFSLVTLLVMSVASIASAKRVKLKPRTALKEAKAAIAKVAGSSDAKIRVAVFEAKLSLARRTTALIKEGMQSEIPQVKQKALERALESRTRRLRQSAVDEVGALLCSGNAELAAIGRGLEVRIRSKSDVKRLRSILVKCPGSVLSDKAKTSMIDAGGSQGWALIAKDLEDKNNLTKQKRAKALALRSKSKAAAQWAMKRIHQEDEMGELARDIMIGFAGTRIGRGYVSQLKRAYRAAKRKDDFARRLRLAMILGNLSGVKSVQDTLFAAFSPDYKPPKGITNTQARAWKGLRNVRKLSLLRRDISKRHKLKVRDLFCTVKTDEEAQAPFDWLYLWTRKSQSSTLYKLLEKCYYSDHPHARKAAIIALAKLGNRKNMKLFEAALIESDPVIKQAGARGIAAVASKGDEARLGKLLQRERSEDGKLALIAGLKRLGTPESIRPLKFMVFRQPKSVTLAAINAMAATKDPKIAKNIASLKTSPDDEIRTTVWRHLLSLDAETYAPSFVSGSKAWLEPRHVQDLAKVKAIPLIVFAEVAKNSRSEVSAEALKVLARAGNEGASHILDTIENHKDEMVAASALVLLGKLRKKSSLNYYAKMTDHEFGQVRAKALGLVARYGTKRKHLPIAMAKRSDADVVASIAAHLATYKLAKKRR